MKRKSATLLLVSTLISHPLYAMGSHSVAVSSDKQTASMPSIEPSLSLGQVLKEAGEKSPEILAAKAKWESEKAKIGSVAGWPDPQIGVEFWGKEETWYDVSQTVPFPGKTITKAQSQAHAARREKALYESKQKEVLQKVKVAFYNYYLADKQVGLFKQSEDFMKRFSELAQNRYSTSQSTQMDVLKAQVEYAKASNRLFALEEERKLAQAELNALLGRESGFPVAKPSEPPWPNISDSDESLVSLALNHRPELVAARHHVEHMGADLAAAYNEFLPDTMLQYSRRTFDNGMADDNIYMIKVNVPLWFWKQSSGVEAGKKAKEEAEHELAAMETMTQWELKSWFSKLKISGHLLELYKKNSIYQSESLMNAAMAGYETGSLSYLEFIDNYRSWIEIQMEYFRLLSEYWLNMTMLEKITAKDFIS